MRDLILKMVSKGVISSDNANRLINMKQNIDPIWKGIQKGFIDERKLARFYEEEGFPVIYEEGTAPLTREDFSRFFTPDVIARYLVFPISFKKDSKDIIIGFLNASHLESVRAMIQQIFPDFNTTYFHIPYTLFRKMVYKSFMFDMNRYAAVVLGIDAQVKVSAEIKGDRGEIYQQLVGIAEQVFYFSVENGSAVYKDETMTSRFPLASLPTFRDSIQKGYYEISADSSVKVLSHTEKILLFTNMGVKRDDRIVIVSRSPEHFFMLINPRLSRKELESMIDAQYIQAQG